MYKIVIDVGFGDAGKGVTVDNLCNDKSLIVRFSGGQNAGHTVKVDGIKHTFSSYGAGTFRNCPTFFTEDTCIFLNSIFVEKQILEQKGISDPKLFVHPLTHVTSPYDVIINRKNTKDQSVNNTCGVGVGTTMKRNLETPYKLYAIDFLNKKILKEKLKSIKMFYNLTESYEIEEMFMEYLDMSLPFDFLTKIDDSKYSDIVFEGSQGILLDMDHGIFPDVTFANTTSKNAWKYIPSYRKKNTEIFYVSRCYQTRHGDGWMSNNDPLSLVNNDDEINVYNEWQGNFRVGELDYDLINHSILVDYIYSEPNNPKNYNLVFTCLDQRPDFYLDRKMIKHNLSIWKNDSSERGNMKPWN